ncbi:MAG: SufD family Fe-S cluster assembly protein [Rickettsiales bacterium]|jgi:hypothetical protein|nr:SufD family Fe-S cluster assembly protein [Rickettsiales bacterium]
MAHPHDYFKNIRMPLAETRVYKDGIFMPDLSSISEDTNLPLHIIHTGKITGVQNWAIDMNERRDVFLTARIETSGASKIKIEINANLENVGFDGKLIIKNSGRLDLEIIGNNNCNDTKIKCLTKLLAGADSENILTGLAVVPPNIAGAKTDISFSALCDPRAKLLQMSPTQRISSVPLAAEHSASIYRPAPPQIRYLETAGLSAVESAELLKRVFMEEII